MTDTFRPSGSQYPLQLPAQLRPGSLEGLVSGKSPIADHIHGAFEIFTFLAECQATFNESERVSELDDAVREMIDCQRDGEHLKQAVLATAQSSSAAAAAAAAASAANAPGVNGASVAGDNVDPSRAIFERTEVLKTNYRDLTGLQKYGHAKHYDDFKRRVFDIEKPDDDYPGTASFFRRPNRDGNTGEEGEGEDEEEELEMTYRTKRNLKCPITMMTFKEPVKSKVCVHVFSRDAVMEMLRRNRGAIKCPVAGCDKIIRSVDLERDRVMERRVRDEEEEEGRQGEALSSEAGDDILDIL